VLLQFAGFGSSACVDLEVEITLLVRRVQVVVVFVSNRRPDNVAT
jgi:hypothetical protein